MSDSATDQREAFDEFNRLTILFASRVQPGGAPFPQSDDFNDIRIREVFGRLEALFAPRTLQIVANTKIESFLSSRSLCDETISGFNQRVARARQALLREIRGQRWTWARIGTVLAFVAATCIPLYNFVHDEVLPSRGKLIPRSVSTSTTSTTSVQRSSQRLKLAFHNVPADGCKDEAQTFKVVAPGLLDTSRGGQDAAPAGWEFELSGNGSHGIRGLSVSGTELTFTLHAEGGGTVQGGSFGIPKTCVGATGANSATTVYAYVFLK